MNKTALYLLYAFAVATVLAMSATTIVLALLLIVFIRDLYRKTVRREDFKKDSLLYVVLFAWKAFTRALATSVREIPKIKGVWDRVPYIVIGFYRIHREAVVKICHILFHCEQPDHALCPWSAFSRDPPLYKPLIYENTGPHERIFRPPEPVRRLYLDHSHHEHLSGIFHNKRFFYYPRFLTRGARILRLAELFSRGIRLFPCPVGASRSFKTILKYSRSSRRSSSPSSCSRYLGFLNGYQTVFPLKRILPV